MTWVRRGSAVTDPASAATPRFVTFSEKSANDSDKSFDLSNAVAGDSLLLIDRIRVEFRATAVAGTRVITLELFDPDSNLMFALNANASGAPTASDVRMHEFCARQHYVAAQQPTETIPGASIEYLPPHFYLYPGWTLTVRDSAAIDPTDDDMTVHISARRV